MIQRSLIALPVYRRADLTENAFALLTAPTNNPNVDASNDTSFLVWVGPDASPDLETTDVPFVRVDNTPLTRLAYDEDGEFAPEAGLPCTVWSFPSALLADALETTYLQYGKTYPIYSLGTWDLHNYSIDYPVIVTPSYYN